MARTSLLSMLLLVCVACGKKAEPHPAGSASSAPAGSLAPITGNAGPGVASASAVDPIKEIPKTPAGSPPPDGKYERVTIEGVTVPMIQVMNNGAVVLVDTDGKKPRSWEEQYKRKRELPAGQFDVHKSNTNNNDSFDDDKIDKEGLWIIDAKGNLTKH